MWCIDCDELACLGDLEFVNSRGRRCSPTQRRLNNEDDVRQSFLVDALVIFVTICIIYASIAQIGIMANTIYDVMSYGGIGDGKHDEAQAFIKAWGATCSSTAPNPTMNVPQDKIFSISPVQFQGPCQSPNIYVQIMGKIVAPSDMNSWTGCVQNSWIYFNGVTNLEISGSGQIDGQGSFWWGKGYRSPSCGLPTALHFNNCNNLKLSGLTHLNPPRNHISLGNCKNVNFANLQISAPANSPNTDGIDISASSQVQIVGLNIQTGDDCIAINNLNSYINISHVACGPGHGISIGSIGDLGSPAQVEQIYVGYSNFTQSQNGCRIKTKPGGTGYARSITFEQINLINVQNPIIIDQFYCNGLHNCTEQDNAVAVSDVTYNYVQGSSVRKDAINLNCSSNVPCQGITMNQVTITGDGVFSSCNNANGKSIGSTPQVPCLSPSTL